MAKKSSSFSGHNKDPREAFEQAGQQMFEALNKGFSEALGVLQEVTSTIEQRLEEVFGPRPGSKSKASEKANIVDTTAKKVPTTKQTPAKKATPKKAPAAKKPATQKSGASGPTRKELYEQATKLNIAGRSKMNKAQLAKAIAATKK